jgi:hypothetical protein
MTSDIGILIWAVIVPFAGFLFLVLVCCLIDNIPTSDRVENQKVESDDDKAKLDKHDAFVLACISSGQSKVGLRFCREKPVRFETVEVLIKHFVDEGGIDEARAAASLVHRELTNDELSNLIRKQSGFKSYELAVRYGLKDLRDEIIRETRPSHVINWAKSCKSISRNEIAVAFREFLGRDFQQACFELCEYGRELIGGEQTREISSYAVSFALTYSPRYAKEILGGIGALARNNLLQRSSVIDQLVGLFLDESSCFARPMEDFVQGNSEGVLNTFYCVKHASPKLKEKAVKFFIDRHAAHLAEELL